jgi:hypothetical protein
LIVWVNAADDSTKQLFTKRGYVHSKFLAEQAEGKVGVSTARSMEGLEVDGHNMAAA